MSKLIHTRYEYAQYDDAQGVLSPGKDVPPTYPPTLDMYRVNSVAATAQAFGTNNLTSSGAALTAATPALATLNLSAPLTNTTLVGLQVINAVPTLNGTPTSLIFYCGPGQTITVPCTINSGNLSLAAYLLSLSATSVPFAAVLTWNL